MKRKSQEKRWISKISEALINNLSQFGLKILTSCSISGGKPVASNVMKGAGTLSP